MGATRTIYRWAVACACMWLLACGLLDAHHVATVSHARLADGTVIHLQVEVSHDADDDRARLHGADRSTDHGCPHAQPVTPPIAVTAFQLATRVQTAWRVEASSHRDGASTTRVLHFAPKTSPPRSS